MALIRIITSYSYEIWDDEGKVILESNSDFEKYIECLDEATDLAKQLKQEGK